MEIKDGPAEANLLDAPEMAVTPAPVVGQIRQSPDGANSSVVDATSTCGGRGSVANLDNVADEETDGKAHQGNSYLLNRSLVLLVDLFVWGPIIFAFISAASGRTNNGGYLLLIQDRRRER